MKKKASKLVGAAILGLDGSTVIVNGTAYAVMPPTIERIAGAAYYLADVQECASLGELVAQMKDIKNAAKALAWFLCDEQDTSEKMIKEVARLASVLAKGTIDEVVAGLTVAYSLIGVENFTRLSALARSVGMLTAKPKLQATPAC